MITKDELLEISKKNDQELKTMAAFRRCVEDCLMEAARKGEYQINFSTLSFTWEQCAIMKGELIQAGYSKFYHDDKESFLQINWE